MHEYSWQTFWFGSSVFLLMLASPGCKENIDCIAEGTMVATPWGTVAVEDIRVGDMVYSVKEGTSQRVESRVVALRSAIKPCRSITTASGKKLRSTKDHPIYDPTRGDYLTAHNWWDGDSQQVMVWGDGSLVADHVVAISPVEEGCLVFDITVDSAEHNFIAGGILVHNKSPPQYLEDVAPRRFHESYKSCGDWASFPTTGLIVSTVFSGDYDGSFREVVTVADPGTAGDIVPGTPWEAGMDVCEHEGTWSWSEVDGFDFLTERLRLSLSYSLDRCSANADLKGKTRSWIFARSEEKYPGDYWGSGTEMMGWIEDGNANIDVPNAWFDTPPGNGIPFIVCDEYEADDAGFCTFPDDYHCWTD